MTQSCAVLLADAKTAASWTGRMIDGDWFRFPLDGAPGRVASWAGHEGILAEVAMVAGGPVVEVHRELETLLLVARFGWSGTSAALGKQPSINSTPIGELEIASGWLAILEAREPGSYLPHDLERASMRRGPYAGAMVLAVAAGTYRVSHEVIEDGGRAGERLRLGRRVECDDDQDHHALGARR